MQKLRTIIILVAISLICSPAATLAGETVFDKASRDLNKIHKKASKDIGKADKKARKDFKKTDKRARKDLKKTDSAIKRWWRSLFD